eukprot:scaffold115849_cov56-Phaeocystis_antarctica.AAC.2
MSGSHDTAPRRIIATQVHRLTSARGNGDGNCPGRAAAGPRPARTPNGNARVFPLAAAGRAGAVSPPTYFVFLSAAPTNTHIHEQSNIIN